MYNMEAFFKQKYSYFQKIRKKKFIALLDLKVA